MSKVTTSNSSVRSANSFKRLVNIPKGEANTVKRQFLKPSEILDLLHFKTPTLNAKKRRLDNPLTVQDLRKIAKRRTPKAAFDYMDGAAEGELSLRRAYRAFRDIEFHSDILHPTEGVDTLCRILGGLSSMPFGMAPTGFMRLIQTEGEIAGAGAVGVAGILFTLSTLGTTSTEDVKAANSRGRNWLQLYVMRKREISYALVERAKKVGFDMLIFTVDTPVAGAYLRGKCNGFSIPPRITSRMVLDAVPCPWWWFDFLATLKFEFASPKSTGGIVGELFDSIMDLTTSHGDLAVIRSTRDGKIVVKGAQTVADVKRFVDAGVDGVLLSNHGGRRLDRAPVPFHLLPHMVREVGKDMAVMVDTGIMNGADIVTLVALGADFALIGHAHLYGLMAGGRADVDRTTAILRDRLVHTMKLLGASSIMELEPRRITQLTRYVPAPKLAQHTAESIG